MSDCHPGEAERRDLDPSLAEAKRQNTLLRAELRGLSRQLSRRSAELAEVLTRKEELEAAFATAMAERSKILESRAWRLTRAVQQAAGQCASAVSRLLHPVAGHRPNPSPPALPQPEMGAPSDDDTSYEGWTRSYDSLSDDDRHLIATRIATLVQRPLISIVLTQGQSEAHNQTVPVPRQSALFRLRIVS